MGGQNRPSQYERLNFVFVPNADAGYLRIKSSIGMNILGNGIYLDDVAVRKISCEYPDVNTIHVSGLTDVSARIEWGAVSAESYNVKIATKEIDPESETGDAYDGASSAGNVHNATGLEMATTYYVYVQSVCGAEGSSEWVGPVTFETMCPETDLALEDFEEEDVLECWRIEGGSVSISSDTAFSGESCVLFEGDAMTRLMSPTLSVSPLSGYMVSLRAYTENMATVTIGVVPDASEPGNYLPLASDLPLSYKEGWKELSVYLDVLGEDGLEEYAASKNIVIVTDGRVYVDDVSLKEIPECRKPSNIGITSLSCNTVTLTWDAAEGQTYSAVLKSGGETVRTISEGVTSPLTINELTPNTEYTLELTASCGSSEKSEPAIITFNAGCGAYSFPFFANFDGKTGPYIQYAIARINSIMRKNKNITPGKVTITNAEERALVLRLSQLNNVVFRAAAELEPSIISDYTYTLAQLFSSFYNASPIMSEENAAVAAGRLKLAKLTRDILTLLLYLLGIKAPEVMLKAGC